MLSTIKNTITKMYAICMTGYCFVSDTVFFIQDDLLHVM